MSGIPYLFEIRSNQCEAQVNHIHLVAEPVIKGDIAGKVIEIPFLLEGYEGAGHLPDGADTFLLLPDAGFSGVRHRLKRDLPAGVLMTRQS